jgi:hypothetical protein
VIVLWTEGNIDRVENNEKRKTLMHAAKKTAQKSSGETGCNDNYGVTSENNVNFNICNIKFNTN